MAGLSGHVPAIHALIARNEDVDARDKRGHDAYRPRYTSMTRSFAET